MSFKLALLFVSMVLVSCRIVNLEKASLSLTAGPEELNSPKQNILKWFLHRFYITSDDELSPFLQGCRQGTCKYCTHKLGHYGCFVATVEGSSIEIQLTLDGRTVLQTSIDASDPHPPKICRENIAGISALTDVCIQVKSVDLNNASGCVNLSFKLYKKPFFRKVCFEIPMTDDENDESDSVEVIQDRDVLAFEPSESSA